MARAAALRGRRSRPGPAPSRVEGDRDLAAWFGDTAGDVSAEQAEQLNALHTDIESRWPDDDASTRTAVLTGATQIVLGDATLESITNGSGPGSQRRV